MAMRNIILLLFGLPTLLLVGCETAPYRSRSERSHYDAYGNVVGTSRRLYDGRLEHYDAYGNVVGTSRRLYDGRLEHYDAYGNVVGTSRD